MRTLARLVWLLPFLLLAGCSADEPPTRVKVRSTVSPFQHLSIDQALAKAKTDRKLVMMVFCSASCYWCAMLDIDTWSDEQVQAWLRGHVVAIKIDADKDPAAADKYKVKGFPQILFLRPDGSEIDRLTGFRDAEQFVQLAERITAGKKK
jgi:thioredoxin-related protein